MLVNEEVNLPRLCSADEFQTHYKQAEHLKLRRQFTCDPKPKTHLGVISMQEDYILHGMAASDIEFLAETNKQYAELGPKEGPASARDNLTCFNDNGRNNESYSYTDLDFGTDYPERDNNEDFETFYDTDTGETTVKLGAFEYIIDIASYFNGTEEMSQNTDTILTQTTGLTHAKPKDLPIAMIEAEDAMMDDRVETRAYNCANWLQDEEICENMHYMNTKKEITTCDIKGKTPDTADTCTRNSFCNTDVLPNVLGIVENIQPLDCDPRWSKCQLQSSGSNSVMTNDNSKTLPSFASFNMYSKNESHSQNRTGGESFLVSRWNVYDDCNVHMPDMFNCLKQMPYTPFCSDIPVHCQSSLENNKTFNEAPPNNVLGSRSYSNTDTDKTGSMKESISESCSNHMPSQRDGGNCTRENHCMFESTSSQTNLPSPRKLKVCRHEDERYTDIERGTALSVNQEAAQNLNQSLFEVTVSKAKRKWKRGCRLWEYIRNLLLDPSTNPVLIKWVDRNEGTFKLVQNKVIAHMWGMKKGNGDMSYEKLSRAMRYYYKKHIFESVLGKRLVYRFGPCATGWKENK